MALKNHVKTAMKWTAGGIGAAAGAYAAYALATWARYGRVPRPESGAAEDLLERFMPVYEVVERHRIRVQAPAAITYRAACEQDLERSPIVNAIFRARQLVLGGELDERPHPRGLIAMTRSLGWGTLAEIPDREIVMGAVTQPWVADVVFRSIDPERFAAFDEPDYVKIVWNLRVDPVDEQNSIFRTETRVATTDAAARRKFRRYWATFSPGIILIRWLSLGPLKRDAEKKLVNG